MVRGALTRVDQKDEVSLGSGGDLRKSKISFLAKMHKPRELSPSPLDLLLKTFAAPAMTIELALQFINLSPDP